MRIGKIAQNIADAFKGGKKLFICGNGGSASQSQHLAGELVGRYRRERKPLPAIALTTNTAIITAIANDYGFDQIFVRQLSALASKGDVLLTLTTSGKSKNIILAEKWGEKAGMKVIRLPNRGEDTPAIQENHFKMIHKIAELVEEAFV